jgi:hypothetical protein
VRLQNPEFKDNIMTIWLWRSLAAVCGVLLLILVPPLRDTHAAQTGQYKNFRVAIYIPAAVVEKMKDPQWLQNSYDTISSQLKFDKVYIETHRNHHTVDDQLLELVKKFFLDHGVKVAGGIAFTTNEPRLFASFCYTDPRDRDNVKMVSELTARHFDEIILDDFFFNNSKLDSDIAAKGSKSWTDFRLELMDGAARDLVIGPARAVNPKVKVIIKFPNWYEHFQGLGFDLDKEPKMFDGIYTGTETRDPEITDQHLQQYESYQIFRYFENIKPGGNGGGWVDTYGARYIDRYAEQLWDSMFAKAPEMTLFNWDELGKPAEPGKREPWKDQHTSFDYDQMLAYRNAHGDPTMARAAGYSLEKADAVVGQLGKPIGIKSYKPYQSTGEDFLHNFLGMIGIPMNLYPEFPTDSYPILLTEAAKFDADIVNKIKEQLRDGKKVVITSGLLHALQGKGIEDIVELRYTGHKVAVHDYSVIFGPGTGNTSGINRNAEVLIPEIRFLTNDAWSLVRGMANGNGFPLLIMDQYSKGTLYVLTIPENFTDLYQLPPETLSALKTFVMGDFPVRLEGPSQVSLFAYDNNTFIVESFLDHEVQVKVSTTWGASKIKNLITGETVNGSAPPVASARRMSFGAPRTSFPITVKAHSFVAFTPVQ